jgi:hypothetical protein
MKNISILLILLLTVYGCKKEKEIIISQPLISIQNESSKVSDTLIIKIFEHAEAETKRIIPTYYRWTISDNEQKIVYSDFKDSSSIVWMPKCAGLYTISAQIGYDGNKSITSSRDIVIFENVSTLQKKLAGKWYGDLENTISEVFYVEVTFSESGHYFGIGHSYEDGSDLMSGPFGCSSYNVDGSYFIQPSDLPCNKFLINNTIGNIGYGLVYGSQEYRFGDYYEYYCQNDGFLIKDLQLINSNTGLIFNIEGNKYDLTRDGYPSDQNYTVDDFIGRYKGTVMDGSSWLPQYWLDITKSLNDPNKIVLGCFPNLCFSIEANISMNTISIPETTFSHIPATSHGGSMVDYYYDEIISGSGTLYNKGYLQIDYKRKTVRPSGTYVETGHISVIKQH